MTRSGPVAALALVVALGAVALAERAKLWNDELFTLYINRLDGLDDVWSELKTGVEQTPFAFYAITRASTAPFGDGLLALRLPEILGYLLMTVCLHAFVAHRTAPVYGMVAAVLPLMTIAYSFAYEARAYGLVLGFSAAALVCWQRATEDGPRRVWWVVALGVSLAMAVGSHYYAILILGPLGAAELERWRERRRPDLLVAAALCGALVPIVLFLPLVRAADDYSTVFWQLPTFLAAVRFYPFLLGTGGSLALAAALAGVVVIARRNRAEPRRLPSGIPLHELVAVATLIVLPLLAVILGKLVTDAFTARYALTAVIGLAAGVAFVARWADAPRRGLPTAAVVLLVVLGATAVVRYASDFRREGREAAAETRTLRFLQANAPAGAPIVVAGAHEFFELSHRAAQDGGRPRLLYLADTQQALRWLGTDAVELGVSGMARVAPLEVQPLRQYLRTHRRLYVFGDDGDWDWLNDALDAAGAGRRVAARGANGDVLYDVRL
ncbi:MAG: glycosyltransferase family 39 protein [Solirubrobacteraceae bacterium]